VLYGALLDDNVLLWLPASLRLLAAALSTASYVLEACIFKIVSAVQQAMVRGDLEILQDWCYEAVSLLNC
jgi:hypothetical protein